LELVPRKLVPEKSSNPNPEIVFANNQNIRIGKKVSRYGHEDENWIWCVKVILENLNDELKNLLEPLAEFDTKLLKTETNSAFLQTINREQAKTISIKLNAHGYRTSVETIRVENPEWFILNIRSFGNRISEVKTIISRYNLEPILDIFESKQISILGNEPAKNLYQDLLKIGVKILPPEKVTG
jgi:hypothetical protein